MKKLLIIPFIFLISCTENQRAKKWGGSANVELPNNTKLINVTWKNADLWYLTRPMKANEIPETHTFQERSNFGIIEGKVIFTESK